MTTIPRRGRRIAIALGVAAAIAVVVLAWLGAPLAVDEWWIRKLRSQDESEVRAAIAKINERRTVRAAPALLSMVGASERPMIVPVRQSSFGLTPVPVVALAADALRMLDRSPEWFVSRIESGSATERKAAIDWAGARGWVEAVPSLRAVVEGNGPLAPMAALALARILPVIRAEEISTGEGSTGRSIYKVRLRFTNPTGRSLWFLGESPTRPLLTKSVSTKGPRSSSHMTFPSFSSSDLGPQEFPPGSSFVIEDVGLPGATLRFSINLSHSASTVPNDTEDLVFDSWDAVTVKSNALKPEKP